ncbi:porin PorA family protein [Spongisporangium articulatum]|uniref:Porin PorA family protein n=1 Tax=Spongisporangium articulatum TaxID=3362603 RepID=A0ABW8ATS9_9ACTN
MLAPSHRRSPRVRSRRRGSRRPSTARLGLLGAGVFLLVLAALLPFYAYPRLAVLPADPAADQVQRATDATVLVPDADAAAGARLVRHTPVAISTHVGADPGWHPEGTVVWQLATQVTQGPGAQLVDARVETISLDRRTARAVNCCGDSLVTDAGDAAGTPLRHTGYLTFPFDTQPRTYPLWDNQLQTARPARYLGETRRAGLRVSVYRAVTEWTPVGTQELPGALFGLSDASVRAVAWYADVRDYFVEPTTGSTVETVEKLRREYRYDDRTLTALSADLRSDPLPAHQLDQVRTGAAVLPWLRSRAAVVLVLCALLMLVFHTRHARTALG